MAYQFSLSTVLPATPDAIYRAWLDTRRHSAMTGGAAVMSSELGAQITAWDGYISGTNVDLVPGERIVQTWRTTKFSAAEPDSTITVQLQRTAEGTLLTLIHANVPDGHVGYEQGGWQQFYFEPMRRYFSRLAHLPDASGKAKSHQAKKAPPERPQPRKKAPRSTEP
jgi:activator of HSP90 ATPase